MIASIFIMKMQIFADEQYKQVTRLLLLPEQTYGTTLQAVAEVSTHLMKDIGWLVQAFAIFENMQMEPKFQ